MIHSNVVKPQIPKAWRVRAASISIGNLHQNPQV
jgi:hypothetical protein